MSQSERISRIHFLLKNKGKVSLADLRDEFEVSRSTIMRDFELMRDRLRSPIQYERKTNSYVYKPEAWQMDKKLPGLLDLPGIWVNPREAYAMLTLMNVARQIDPGNLIPHVDHLRGLLKRILCDYSDVMWGYDRKLHVDIPNLNPSNYSVTPKLSGALLNDMPIDATWKDKNGAEKSARLFLHRFILSYNGWSAEAQILGNSKETSGKVLLIPLQDFVACTVVRD